MDDLHIFLLCIGGFIIGQGLSKMTFSKKDMGYIDVIFGCFFILAALLVKVFQ